MHTKYILPGKDHLKLCPVPLLSVYMRCVCVCGVCVVCVCVRAACACPSASVHVHLQVCMSV